MQFDFKTIIVTAILILSCLRILKNRLGSLINAIHWLGKIQKQKFSDVWQEHLPGTTATLADETGKRTPEEAEDQRAAWEEHKHRSMIVAASKARYQLALFLFYLCVVVLCLFYFAENLLN